MQGEKQIQIAIIGGGASGTLTAINLLRKLNREAKLYLIEKHESALFRGAAYSSQLSYEPLNVHAGKMSAFAHLPDSFYQWVVDNRSTAIHRESFVSRRWYGDYLTELYQKFKAQNKLVKAKTVIDTVTSVCRDEASGLYTIKFEGRDALTADYVVFATGNEPPQDIFTPEQISAMGTHYVSLPWFSDPLKGVKPSDNVLIVGTGLTMVDHVVSLYKQGHQGKVYCFSRNGYLPLPHNDTSNYTFDVSFDGKSAREVFFEIRRAFRNAAAKGVTWQSVIDGLRIRTARIWRNLPTAERKVFLRYFKNYWEIHRHRMPQASAGVLEQMQNEGKLELHNGKYNKVEVNGDAVTFYYTDKATGEQRSFNTNLIINCTGPSGDYMQCSNAMMKDAIAKGWMKQDELKIGIEIGIRGEIMMSNGIVLKNCYAVGPLRKASEWESTAMREIRSQADETAQYIADKVATIHDVLVDI
jgi:uncharacterized NAD(P)/FAD-binding protein YdhS